MLRIRDANRRRRAKGWNTTVDVRLDTVNGTFTVTSITYGGEAVFTGHMDDDFIAQVSARLNSGLDAGILFRYLDPDNFYRARIETVGGTNTVYLEKMLKGKLTTLQSTTFSPTIPTVLRVKCNDSSLKVWVNPTTPPGNPTLSTSSDADLTWGGVALSGWDPLFDNLKVAYDTNTDDDITSADDIVIDEDFSATTVTPTYDDAGNLTKDADYTFVYDAWNNLVKVKAQNDADVVIGQYAYYADNRRASKTVTNRGELDGTTYFFYDGLREIEERNGSEAVVQQYVCGHEYIDQLLMIRGANGTWFAHQDANWNVIALTTPNGDVAEEYQYQPYGLPQVKRHLAYGDSDADGDVDSTDNTAHFNALTTYNRFFDADFDGDVGNNVGDPDRDAWDASYNDPAASITMVVANRSFSPAGNPFLFTGRRLDAETGLYYYRFRTYHPTLKTFIQRDPLGYVDSCSLYQYVGGTPLRSNDPLGLEVVHVPSVGNGPAYYHVYDADGNFLGTVSYNPNNDYDEAIAYRTAKLIESKKYTNAVLLAIFGAADKGLVVTLVLVGLLIPGPEDLVPNQAFHNGRLSCWRGQGGGARWRRGGRSVA